MQERALRITSLVLPAVPGRSHSGKPTLYPRRLRNYKGVACRIKTLMIDLGPPVSIMRAWPIARAKERVTLRVKQ